MAELGGAVIATSLVLVVVFVPVLGLEGSVGRLYAPIAVAISAAIVFSTINAISFTAGGRQSPAARRPARTGLAEAAIDPPRRWLEALEAPYARLLERVLRHRRLVLVTLLVGLLLTAAALRARPTTFIPQEDNGQLRGVVILPEGTAWPAPRRCWSGCGGWARQESLIASRQLLRRPLLRRQQPQQGSVLPAPQAGRGALWRRPQQRRGGRALNGRLRRAIPDAAVQLSEAPSVRGFSGEGGLELELLDVSSGQLSLTAFEQEARDFIAAAQTLTSGGSPAFDARSDIFAVGILLWELLTWKRLFRRDSDLATLVAVADEPIPHANSLRPDLPIELDRICARALARTLEERYPSAQAMQGDLEALIRKYGWEADSIRLQQYIRDVFSDKLALQDEAIRAAGLGSIEDLLVRMEEGTRMAWMEADAEGEAHRAKSAPSGLELPQAPPTLPGTLPASMQEAVAALRPAPARPEARTIRPPSGPVAILPVPNWPQQQNLGIAGDTGSTLRGAAGQVLMRSDSTGSHEILLPPPSGWKRVAVIVATSAMVAAAALGAVFWPTGEAPLAPAVVPAEAKIRVILDERAVVSVDGVDQPAGREVELVVTARVAHDLHVKGDSGHERNVHVPPLEPGAVQPVRVNLAQQP